MQPISLNTRQRNLAIGTLGVVIVAVIILGVRPALDAVGSLERRVISQEQLRDDTVALAAKLQQVRQRTDASIASSGGTTISSLLAWLEKQASERQLSNNVRQISPLTVNDDDVFRQRASLRLESIGMDNLLRFLEVLEASPSVRIVSGDLRRQDDREGGVSFSLEVGLL